ncbi:hypothetical protein HAX54_045815, partial [Datura stramonium]|nr:hypothetical protein [Datura stramonium]
MPMHNHGPRWVTDAIRNTGLAPNRAGHWRIADLISEPPVVGSDKTTDGMSVHLKMALGHRVDCARLMAVHESMTETAPNHCNYLAASFLILAFTANGVRGFSRHSPSVR